VACKVKADPESQSMRRLQAAGNAVMKATDNLVRSAQQAIEHEEEQSFVLSKRRVSGIAQEIVAREAILKKERELDEAREKLSAIRRAKYGHKGVTQQSEEQSFLQSNMSNMSNNSVNNSNSVSNEYHAYSHQTQIQTHVQSHVQSQVQTVTRTSS